MPERFEIRNYREGDFPRIKKLWKATGMDHPERRDDATVIEHCNKMGGKLLILEDHNSGTIIGTSWMTWDGRRIHLHHFGIDPAYQRRGLGTMLGHASLEWIRQMKQQVKLEVQKNNTPARKLYERLGFFAYSDYDIYMIRETANQEDQ